MFARLGQEFVEAHVLTCLLRRVIMDMDMPKFREGLVEQQLHVRRNLVSLPDGQRTVDADRQVDYQVWPKAMGLHFLQLLDALYMLEKTRDLLRDLPARHRVHQCNR